jgi:hypothetical protein
LQPPKGQPLLSLSDAADYVISLPNKVHDTPHWQVAIVQLIDAGERRNFVVHARIAVLRALELRLA